jgi:hypothetical protein
MFASFLIWGKDALDSDAVLHVTLRHDERLFDTCIQDLGTVKSIDELRDMWQTRLPKTFLTYPGPLCEVKIGILETTVWYDMLSLVMRLGD